MKTPSIKIITVLLTISIAAVFSALSQTTTICPQGLTGSQCGERLNTVTTAVPFLIIAPDSRAGAMGDAGVATVPDANSIHWNPAKMAWVEDDLGFAASYTPWLRRLVPDISLMYLSGYKKIDKMSTVGLALRYFTLGDIQFTDEFGNNTMQFRPNEFSLEGAYSRKLFNRFSGGIAARGIYSNLTGGVFVAGAETKPGLAFAVDLSGYYNNQDLKLGDKKAAFAAGFNISNIGNKMSYSTTAKTDFIPINLKIGARFTLDLDDHNSISVTVDGNKLLVPTPPIYARDSAGKPVFDSQGKAKILAGKDPNRAVANGMFESFSDAPGVIEQDANGNVNVRQWSVLTEELREITGSFGAEYWYDKQFALRAGYFTEHILKGNRKYLTVGAGLKYNVFGLDFAYLIPAVFQSATTQRSPLENTLRFTLHFDFAAFKSKEEVQPDKQ